MDGRLYIIFRPGHFIFTVYAPLSRAQSESAHSNPLCLVLYYISTGIRHCSINIIRSVQRVSFGTPVDFKGRGRTPGVGRARSGRGGRPYRHHNPLNRSQNLIIHRAPKWTRRQVHIHTGHRNGPGGHES